MVPATRASSSPATGSRSSTTRSARSPGAIRPRTCSSPANHAGPVVNEASAAPRPMRLLRPPRRPVAVRAQHRGPQAGEGVERLHRRVRAAGEQRARRQQRRVGIGVGGAVAPQPVGDVAVARRVRVLHGGGDAEAREARHVVGVDALRVLDPRAQPARLPVLRAWPRRRRAPRGWRGRRSRARRPAGRRAGARGRSPRAPPRPVISTPVPSSSRAVREPSVPSMNAFT